MPLVRFDIYLLLHPLLVATAVAAATASVNLAFQQAAIGLFGSRQKSSSDGSHGFKLFVVDGAGGIYLAICVFGSSGVICVWCVVCGVRWRRRRNSAMQNCDTSSVLALI